MREYDNSFIDADDMIFALNSGGEIEFEYNGKDYTMFPLWPGVYISEAYNEATVKEYATPEEAMEYEIEGKKLKDIVPDLKIFFRSL